MQARRLIWQSDSSISAGPYVPCCCCCCLPPEEPLLLFPYRDEAVDTGGVVGEGSDRAGGIGGRKVVALAPPPPPPLLSPSSKDAGGTTDGGRAKYFGADRNVFPSWLVTFGVMMAESGACMRPPSFARGFFISRSMASRLGSLPDAD